MSTEKKLIIPLITPLRRVGGNEFVFEMEESYCSDKFYVCSRTLNELKSTLKNSTSGIEYYDYVVPGMTTGEGDKMDIELWKTMINLTITTFGEEKVIPAIINDENIFINEALDYLLPRKDVKNIFLSIPKNEKNNDISVYFAPLIERFKKEDKKIWLYLNEWQPEKSSESDEQQFILNKKIALFVSNNTDVIAGIKDSRSDKTVLWIDDLIKQIEEINSIKSFVDNKVLVYQGWEHLYPETSPNKGGGIFPLANIEPELMYDYVKGTEEKKYNKVNLINGNKPGPIIRKLCDKYSIPENWITLIKEEFYLQPATPCYESKDFSDALDKFFKNYAEEELENNHVRNFDTENPLKSMSKTLLSDLLSFQTQFFRHNKLNGEKSEFLFIPYVIAIHDNNTSWTEKNRKDGKSYIFMLKEEKFKDRTKIFEPILNSYYIEENIFDQKIFEEVQKTSLSEDIQESSSDFRNRTEAISNQNRKNSHKIYYSSNDKGLKNNYTIFIAYETNPYLKAQIPKSVFEFFARIAIFTKRNTLAVADIKQHATKAAISDIINRNMAHHLSSHVSIRATLDKVLERLKLNYSDLSNEENYFTVLDLLNRFNQYRDERSEYLTYITHFASPISAYLYQDVIRPFIENTLLMDNIAANENINYIGRSKQELLKNKLRLLVVKENGQHLYAIYPLKDDKNEYNSENMPYFRKKTNDGYEYETPVLTGGPDIEISLPGSLGKHALYSILENFIRNSAKHGGDKKHNGLDIIIKLSDLDNQDHITVTLTDNCSFVNDEKIQEFNASIKKEILEKKDLGLIDMKVNACLLEGKELIDINCKKSIEALMTEEGILAYRFKIAKPKKAVFVGEFCKDKAHKDGFFYFETPSDFKKYQISKSFQFAILSDKLYDSGIDYTKQTLLSELPGRVLKYSELPKDFDFTIEQLYEAWLNKLRGIGNQNSQIHLYFQQNENVSPTKEFKNKYKTTEGKGENNIIMYSKEDLQKTQGIETNKNIFFDRHGEIIKVFNGDLITPDNSWVLIDKNNLDFDYITRYDIENNQKLFPLELEEAGLLKILIIDERVAEQSIRDISNDIEASKISNPKFGFTKFDIVNSKLTLFDTAWAANIFFATHLNNIPLKMEVDLNTQHKLNVNIDESKISYETNITSCYGKYTIDEKFNESWKFNKTIIDPICTEIAIVPDILIIHRTKIKELIAKDANFVSNLLKTIPNLIVTTGSGTTHGIKGDFKILPYSTLSDMVLGKRIQKLKFSKLLLQLTKNKI